MPAWSRRVDATVFRERSRERALERSRERVLERKASATAWQAGGASLRQPLL